MSSGKNKPPVPPQTGAAGGDKGRKRPTPPPSAHTTTRSQRARQMERVRIMASEVLFIVLENLRAAAREARVDACRRREREPSGVGPLTWTGGGVDDEDDMGGAVVGAGWWRMDWGPSRQLPEDELFLKTCDAASRASNEWRALAFGAADRAIFSWPKNAPTAGGGSAGRSAARSDNDDPGVRGLRLFERGVLRALVIRGEPPAAAARRLLRPLARSIAEGAEQGIADVLRGLRVLRLEQPSSLFAALTPLPRGAPSAGSRPLLASLVTLDIECWPDAAPVALTHAQFPSLRVLKLTVGDDARGPFDLWSGGKSDEAPARLTRLEARADDFAPRGWADNAPLLVAARTLSALAPTLQWLECARPDTMGDPMVRLLPSLSSLSRLTALTLDGAYDWTTHGPRGNQTAAWLQASRSLMAHLGRSLRALELAEGSASWMDFLSLPPSVSLLRALTLLDACNYCIESVGGLRHLTGLQHLSLQQHEFESWDGELPHPPLLGRDLEALTGLTFLRMTHTARCCAPALENALPNLACLVLDPKPLPVAQAVRARLVRGGGLAVFRGDPADLYGTPPPLTVAQLETIIADASDDEDAEDAQDHEQQHQTLLAMVESLEELDA